MDDQQQARPSDDLEVQVSDLGPTRPATGQAHNPRGTSSPFGSRLSRTQRTARVATALSALLLVFAALLGSFPGLRSAATDLISGLIPTPTSALEPGGDLFYFLPDVPWGTVLVDGHPLTPVPTLDAGHPLRLARGRHTLDWRAVPFATVHCALSVPHSPHDTCPVADRLFLPSCCAVVRQQLFGSLVEMHQSLTTLPTDQREALQVALQRALDASNSSAKVEPGQHYYFAASGAIGEPVTATQELSATLSFRLVLDGQQPEPCSAYTPRIQPCHFTGQWCQTLCTVSPRDIASDVRDVGGPTWVAAALVQPAWEYTALDGTVVAHHITDVGLGFTIAVFRIHWDGVQWQVTAVIGHNTGVAMSDDTVCDPARAWLLQGPLSYIFEHGNPDDGLQLASSSTGVGGCVVVLTRYVQPETGTIAAGPPALFLERFGMLLAANNTAHSLWPQAPRADATEQLIAWQLASQLGVIGTPDNPRLTR